eukprot:953082_1
MAAAPRAQVATTDVTPVIHGNTFTAPNEQTITLVEGFAIKVKDPDFTGDHERTFVYHAADAAVLPPVARHWTETGRLTMTGEAVTEPERGINMLLESVYTQSKRDPVSYIISIRRGPTGEFEPLQETTPEFEPLPDIPAHSGYYNSLFDDSAHILIPHNHHYENGLQLAQVHSNEHYGQDGEYYNGLILGGVIGSGSIVAILVVFCIGLAFGMVICFGYQQKRALEERKKEDWRQDDNV